MPDPIDRLRTDRTAIEHAARTLRDLAISDNYGDAVQPARAFSLALTLDTLAMHVRDLDDRLRDAVVQHCRAIVGPTSESSG
jgi:hypothetical protein